MPKVLLHPGLHKTGTSSAQHLLWKNRAALLPHVEIYQIRHFAAAAEPAHRFSKTADPLELLDLAALFDDVFQGIGPREGRHVLITHEGLSGHMPGWPGVADYGAVPVLYAYYAEYLAERFPHHELELVVTTRRAEDWIWSAYRHQLQAHRLTLDFDAFREAVAAAADFDALLGRLRRTLGDVPVHAAALEDTTALTFGPGEALLSCLDLPAEVMAGLTPVPPANAGPDPALVDQLLALHRSDLPDAAVASRRAEMLAKAGVGGWVRG